MKVLEARHIRKSFVGVRALSDANFELGEGEVCGLVGANGSGKTTFARIVSGLLIPDSGELLLEGQPINLRSHLDAESYRLAMVHQNLSLVPEMTVWENIALGRERTGRFSLLDNRGAIRQAEEAIAAIRCGIPVRERVRNLAPDEKQLVEIAKALAKEPRILILDEPTASLDFHQVEALFAAIRELKSRRVSIVFISHRIWEVARICDRLVAFRNGETVGGPGLLDPGQGRDEDRAADHGAGGLGPGPQVPRRAGGGDRRLRRPWPGPADAGAEPGRRKAARHKPRAAPG